MKNCFPFLGKDVEIKIIRGFKNNHRELTYKCRLIELEGRYLRIYSFGSKKEIHIRAPQHWDEIKLLSDENITLK